jgi:exodeoxyribonuclease-5
MLDTGETVFTNAATAQFGKPETLAYNDPDKPRGRDWQSWDFGYAITAHKAQGSEFDDVIVIDENPMDYARWLYTAVTRARKRLVIVKW